MPVREGSQRENIVGYSGVVFLGMSGASSYGAISFGPLNYKYFASTRLIASVIRVFGTPTCFCDRLVYHSVEASSLLSQQSVREQTLSVCLMDARLLCKVS